jgi:hypothetical protein
MLCQAAKAVRSCVLPSAKRPLTVRAVLVPWASWLEAGLMFRLCRGELTVTTGGLTSLT